MLSLGIKYSACDLGNLWRQLLFMRRICASYNVIDVIYNNNAKFVKRHNAVRRQQRRYIICKSLHLHALYFTIWPS